VNSLTQAAQIINSTDREDGINALLASLGFTDRPLPLDATSRERLGLQSAVRSARVVAAEGSLRALAVDVAPDGRLQENVLSIARLLSLRAPHLLWLIIATEYDSPRLAVATWRGMGSSMRVAAMVTERGRVVDSDAETACALSAARAVTGDVMRHMRWLDILGRDAVTRRFFVALSGAVKSLAASIPVHVPVQDAREISILATSRLLFLSFLETKGWLNSDFGFLANGFAECMATGGAYQRRVLEPLFFGTLNTRVSERAPHSRSFGRIPFLNGGLFSRTTVERIHRHARFNDDALGALFGDVLVRYRFTAREDAASWSQAAIDPEMLGKVFESLMESGDRKRSGVFYTPQEFVEKLTHLTMSATLQRRGVSLELAESLLGDTSAVAHDQAILAQAKELRVLDPACGSGAFLVYVLERLARLRKSLGDDESPSNIRRSVLTRSIFGVDSSPTAVWLCELRLWLSAVIDSDEADPMRVTPLPNLDRQIRVGDSLSGDAFGTSSSAWPASRATCALRDRYTRASGRRKMSLAKRFDLLERERTLATIDAAIASAIFERKEIVRAARSRDLFDERTQPDSRNRERLLYLRSHIRALRRRRITTQRGAALAFAYPTHFSDVAVSGGFDAIIGNPPWIRVHNISVEDRARYRDTFAVYRAGAWSDGARGAQAGRGFAGQVDVAALFIERSVDLLAPGGTIGLLLPSKLWRSLAGGGARQLILDRTHIVSLEDHSDGPDSFEAAAYPSTLVATRVPPSAASPQNSTRRKIAIAVKTGDAISRWTITERSLTLDTSPGSPWLLLPPDARPAFDLLARAGVPLFESILQRPHLGVKTGCNSAFVVRAESADPDLTRIATSNRRGEIETHMLRPLVRGETLTPWRLEKNAERIIWTHDATGQPLRKLPPNADRWLTKYRRKLEQRTDARSDRWWSLFRIESAESTSARVIWSDFGREPRAAVLEAGDPTVPLNTCYSVTCPTQADALAFAAILNSDIAAAWLGSIAEPARGRFYRFLGWTIARLPIPIDWPRARRILAPLADAARRGDPPTTSTLHTAVIDAYNVSAVDVAPLLAWSHARSSK
jgi:hypothetical protein